MNQEIGLIEAPALLDLSYSKWREMVRLAARLATLSLLGLMTSGAVAQQTPPQTSPPPAAAATGPRAIEKPLPGLDTTSMDPTADPCSDMYRYACGRFAANHPIPADQPAVDPFYVLLNVNTQELSTILEKAAAGGTGRGRRMNRRSATTTRPA